MHLLRSTMMFLAFTGLIPVIIAFADDESAEKVLATYAGQEITLRDLADAQPAMVSWLGISVSPEQLETVVDNIILSRLTAQEAEQSGLMKDPEVRVQIDKILVQAYLKKAIPKEKSAIQENDAQTFYMEHRDTKYKTLEQIEVAHILVDNLAEAEAARKALVDGMDWGSAVKKYSKDPLTVKRAGSFGLITPNHLLPPLREAASSLEPGKYSEIIKTGFGYHILRVNSRPPIVYRPFEEVKKDIYKALAQNNEQAQLQQIKGDLWEKYDVSIKEDAIKELTKTKSAERVLVDSSAGAKTRRKPGEATELQVVSETVNLGKRPAKKFTESMLIANTSDKDMTIHRVGSTSPGLQVSVDQNKLKPGERTKMKLDYDPEVLREKGRTDKTIFVESTDNIEPRKFIRLNIEIVRG